MKAVKTVVCILLLLCSSPLFAQARGEPGLHDWWYTLERGKVLFRQGDYGNALMMFEDARRQRRYVYERLERHFINLLSLYEVRRLGDSLDWVERYIQDRHYADAADALEELYYRVPRASFNNSAAAALEALSSLKDYPEAEYWIGETYFVEGELPLARAQFQKALDMGGLLENPAFATDLLYKIAGICRVRQEYNEMERILLSVLSADSLWSSGGPASGGLSSGGPPSGGAETPRDQMSPHAASAATVAANRSFTKQAMINTLEKSGIDQFLTMYRYGSADTAEAHRLLGFYYYSSGRHSRAQEHLMFAFLIQNTIIIDEVKRKQFNYTFATLEGLAQEISRSPLLREYAEKNEYYKTAYYLGASLYGNGKTAPARGIWDSLSSQALAGEWRNRSLAQLQSPRIERAVEMP